MSRFSRHVLAGLLRAGLLAALATPALAGCPDIDRRVRAAIAAGDAVALPGLARAVAEEASCDAAYVEASRRSIALALLGSGQKADGSFAPQAVRAAASVARPWMVSLAYGDLAYEGRDFAAAMRAYDAAIDEIRDPRLVPVPPGREVEAYLAHRAYQAKALAPAYLPSRSLRGVPGGALLPGYRSFTAVSVPVPVRFDTDEARLTPDGERAVDELYAFLSTQPIGTLVLTGHTDSRGTPAHNDPLSLARARGVEEGLRSRGLAVVMEAKGVGDREPFPADDRSKYGEDDLLAFDRRVEFTIRP